MYYGSVLRNFRTLQIDLYPPSSHTPHESGGKMLGYAPRTPHPREMILALLGLCHGDAVDILIRLRILSRKLLAMDELKSGPILDFVYLGKNI